MEFGFSTKVTWPCHLEVLGVVAQFLEEDSVDIVFLPDRIDYLISSIDGAWPPTVASSNDPHNWTDLAKRMRALADKIEKRYGVDGY